jgi:hypothetical protein
MGKEGRRARGDEDPARHSLTRAEG